MILNSEYTQMLTEKKSSSTKYNKRKQTKAKTKQTRAVTN